MSGLATLALLLALAAKADPFLNGPCSTPAATEKPGRDRMEVAHYPFDKAGCYPSGSPMGTKGETLTVVRASVGGYVDPDGNVGTCAANEARVSCNPVDLSICGLLVESQRKQLYPTPLAPAAGTATLTATGAHAFWVGGGTGSQVVTNAGGTVASTGLPCTATAAVPCKFNVTSLGATPVLTFQAVTGSLKMAQLEAGAAPTSIIPVQNMTREVDVITMADPLAGDASLQDWWVSGFFTPNNRAWGAVQWVPISAGFPPNLDAWQIAIGTSNNAKWYVYQDASHFGYQGSSTIASGWPLGSRRKWEIGGGPGYGSFSDWGSPVGARGGSGTGVTAHGLTVNIGFLSTTKCDCYIGNLRFGRGAPR